MSQGFRSDALKRSLKPQRKARRLAAREAEARDRSRTRTKALPESQMAYGARPGLIGRVRLAMIKKGHTRTEFARSIGSNRSTVWSWFNGKRLPSDEQLRAIAEALDVPLEWLLAGGPLLRTKGR